MKKMPNIPDNGYATARYTFSEKEKDEETGYGVNSLCKFLNLGTDFNTDDNADESCLLDCGAFQEEISTKMEKNKKLVSKTLKCLSSDANIETDRLSILKAFTDSLASEEDIFWYHPDHLGSSSWITYTDGSSIQHLHYLPFGETQVDQRATSYAARYTFSAKEKDEETGYSYFGARYYNSTLSVWLSVDPMSDKYPSLSPYAYCANNPVKLVDPDGRDFDPVIDEENKTITITAVYYASNDDKDKLQKGVNAWNAQSGKYTYTTGEGDEQKTYTVNFNLTVAQGDYKTDEDAQAAVQLDRKSNYFIIDDPKDCRGMSDGHNIKVSPSAPERTVIHEIGHTLGIDEGIEVMETGGSSDKIIKVHVSTILTRAGMHCLGSFIGNTNVNNNANPARTYNMFGKFMKNKTK